MPMEQTSLTAHGSTLQLSPDLWPICRYPCARSAAINARDLPLSTWPVCRS